MGDYIKNKKNPAIFAFLKCPLFNTKINKGYGDIFMRKNYPSKIEHIRIV